MPIRRKEDANPRKEGGEVGHRERGEKRTAEGRKGRKKAEGDKKGWERRYLIIGKGGPDVQRGLA